MVWFQLLVFGLVGLNLGDGLVDLHIHTVLYILPFLQLSIHLQIVDRC